MKCILEFKKREARKSPPKQALPDNQTYSDGSATAWHASAITINHHYHRHCISFILPTVIVPTPSIRKHPSLSLALALPRE